MVMRKLLTREEAEELIDEIPEIEILGIENEKLREETYKECIRGCQVPGAVAYDQGRSATAKGTVLQEGKKATATDEKYLKTAEDNLYAELSILLNVPRNRMEDYIRDRIKEREK